VFVAEVYDSIADSEEDNKGGQNNLQDNNLNFRDAVFNYTHSLI
jgi:hypothetical protein